MMAHGALIVGAGQAGLQLAVSLRDHGYDGPVTLVGDEGSYPYQRPPLSKDFLRGERGAGLASAPQARIAPRQGHRSTHGYTGHGARVGGVRWLREHVRGRRTAVSASCVDHRCPTPATSRRGFRRVERALPPDGRGRSAAAGRPGHGPPHRRGRWWLHRTRGGGGDVLTGQAGHRGGGAGSAAREGGRSCAGRILPSHA